MLGCDTEFFQSKRDSLHTLREIAALHKDISVITKLNLSFNFLTEIKNIADITEKQGNILAFSVSLPCYDSAKKWEKGAPGHQKELKP